MNQSVIYLIVGTVFIFLLGSLLHFTYDLSKNNKIVGFVSAVNESVFEHTKLLVLPTILWWVFIYIIKKEELEIDLDKWAFSMLVALLTSIIMVIALYSSYVKSFVKSGKGIVVIDILIFLISCFIGEVLALHFYKYFDPWNYYFSFGVIFIIVVLYGIFTYYPPKLPLFVDNSTKH